MDNREVLVKLQYNTKYGVQLNSSRVIKNYNLYKYLVLKHISEQVYVDYANEDCELVNLKILFDESLVISDKVQIDSFNNIKDILNKDKIDQYDLFTLIDNSYSDIFGHTVEQDLSFEKYTYFYKQLLEISKSLMSKYTEFIGTENFPKNINQLYIKELGDERYNLLLLWLEEPIINDVNINIVINCVQNLTNRNNSLCKIKNYEIPLHKHAQCGTNINVNHLFFVREKVIITKNSAGFYTFKNLIFNIQNSLVIGKWNSNNNKMDLLSSEDVELCYLYNLKYDETKINILLNKTNKSNDSNKSNETNETNKTNETNETNKTNETNETNETNKTNIEIQSENVHQQYEMKKNNNNSNSNTLLMSFFNNLKEKSIKESQLKDSVNSEQNDTINIQSKIIDRNEMIQNLNNANIKETLEKQELLEIEELQETETNQTLNPYNSTIIPIVNEKVSRGRKKSSNVSIGITTGLKQKIPLVLKNIAK